MKLAKRQQGIVTAHDKGYRVVNGQVISPFSGKPLKLYFKFDRKSDYEVHRFTVYDPEYGRLAVNAHQLMAFQKYGLKIFEPDIVIRHLDGNSLNNNENNIAIGSRSDNEFDKPKEVRVQAATTASTKIRRFTDYEMEDIRNFHNGSYKDTMRAFDIKSKGTLHYILNTDYKTVKQA